MKLCITKTNSVTCEFVQFDWYCCTLSVFNDTAEMILIIKFHRPCYLEKKWQFKPLLIYVNSPNFINTIGNKLLLIQVIKMCDTLHEFSNIH